MKLSKGDAIDVTFALKRGESKGDGVFSAAITDETVVQHGPLGNIRLVHTPESIDMTRAENGLVMLFGHDDRQPIGRVSNIRIDADKVLRGDFKFSSHESADRYRAQVADGTLTDVSVGADILDFEVDADNDDLVNITNWRPYEVSLVSVGRIPNARIGFSHTHEEKTMSEDMKADTADQPKPSAQQVLAAHNANTKAAEGVGAQAERNRQKAIRALFSKPRFSGNDFQVLLNHCLDEGFTVEQAQAELLEHIGFSSEADAPQTNPYAPSKPEPAVVFDQRTDGRRTNVSMGTTAEDKLAAGIELALEVKCGLTTDPERRKEAESTGMLALSLLEMGRESLRVSGVSVGRFSDNMRLAHEILTMGHSTSDFPNVLANIATKAAMIGFNEAPETWNQWCKVGNLTDFKQAKRVTTTAFPDLELIPESGEYKFATISDLGEAIQLATYGKKFRISRQALINDDINAFSDIPRKMGRAAARLPGDLAYGVLTANAALLQDTTALFHASHGNLGTAGAPSVTTMQEGFLDMAVQTDPAGNVTALNLEPQFVIGPRALRSTLKVLIGSEKDPTYDAANPGTPINEFYNAVTVVTDARLDADSTTAWYLAASPSQADTVEVAFLNGNQSPVVDQMPMTSPDGRDYYVRLDCAAAALGYVGLWKNAGA